MTGISTVATRDVQGAENDPGRGIHAGTAVGLPASMPPLLAVLGPARTQHGAGPGAESGPPRRAVAAGISWPRR